MWYAAAHVRPRNRAAAPARHHGQAARSRRLPLGPRADAEDADALPVRRGARGHRGHRERRFAAPQGGAGRPALPGRSSTRGSPAKRASSTSPRCATSSPTSSPAATRTCSATSRSSGSGEVVRTGSGSRPRSARRRPACAQRIGGVPLALPALVRAERMTEKAARSRLRLARRGGVLDKVREELGELDEAMRSGQRDASRTSSATCSSPSRTSAGG